MDIDIDIYLLNPFKEPGDGSEDLDPVKKGFILAELLKLNNTDAAPKGSGGKSLVLPKYKWPLANYDTQYPKLFAFWASVTEDNKRAILSRVLNPPAVNIAALPVGGAATKHEYARIAHTTSDPEYAGIVTSLHTPMNRQQLDARRTTEAIENNGWARLVEIFNDKTVSNKISNFLRYQ